MFGSCSVLFANSTMQMVKASATGDNQFKFLVTWVLLVAMLTCLILQTHYLAHGLKYFDALFIVPVFQCFSITFSILGGAGEAMMHA
jgi:hypothetical protein